MFSRVLSLGPQDFPNGSTVGFEVVGNSLLQWWITINA
ncbi:hypothetical protein EV14_1242 [Prochlorococcus sp. MIT 0703]|nr:hypothetical protein EV12_0062 [Prochlorococcus sp. MIT 0701]KGG34348.1 hypothetical protein EV14_1242 [Prochlorococcus sp. MIT 0703]